MPVYESGILIQEIHPFILFCKERYYFIILHLAFYNIYVYMCAHVLLIIFIFAIPGIPHSHLLHSTPQQNSQAGKPFSKHHHIIIEIIRHTFSKI